MIFGASAYSETAYSELPAEDVDAQPLTVDGNLEVIYLVELSMFQAPAGS